VRPVPIAAGLTGTSSSRSESRRRHSATPLTSSSNVFEALSDKAAEGGGTRPPVYNGEILLAGNVPVTFREVLAMVDEGVLGLPMASCKADEVWISAESGEIWITAD
jgi:hypothetical protein